MVGKLLEAALLWALFHAPLSHGQPSAAALSHPPSPPALEALEALAELRDEPVMLNPSLSHYYKPPPPRRTMHQTDATDILDLVRECTDRLISSSVSVGAVALRQFRFLTVPPIM